MVTSSKPKSITITIRDRENKKSRSITVYDTDIDEIEKLIKKALDKEFEGAK
mgnify:CR=1 FL=1